MITIRSEHPPDVAAREALLDAAYGPVRLTKPSQCLRAGRDPALAFVATERGRVVGTVRLWPVAAGSGGPALLLGPLAVAPDCRRRGIGAALMRRAIRAARLAGHAAVLLVGDAAYYGRFGFSAAKTAALSMAGLAEPDRLLALELAAGALDGACGPIRAGAARKPVGRVAVQVAAAQAA
ncbi:MAG TPA: N-acetyltransferase [Xanthobacteraceae bacterium]|nr:N-acetyltransferase [Xanthobacteraceae bacterium]